MREILFRGKQADNGAWINDSPSLDRWKHDGRTWLGADDGNLHEVLPETVGQYTGLTDRLGRKIFEGDIVKDGYGFIYEVLYIAGKAAYYCICNKTNTKSYLHNIVSKHDCTVIGNVLNNPELLEDKANDKM